MSSGAGAEQLVEYTVSNALFLRWKHSTTIRHLSDLVSTSLESSMKSNRKYLIEDSDSFAAIIRLNYKNKYHFYKVSLIKIFYVSCVNQDIWKKIPFITVNIFHKSFCEAGCKIAVTSGAVKSRKKDGQRNILRIRQG